MANGIIAAALAVLIAWAVLRVRQRAAKGSACCGERQETVKKTAVSDRNRSHYPYTVEMQIGGMTCQNCERRVENGLNARDGVWASVKLDTHSAQVLCKEMPDEQVLRQAVREAGYVVTNFARKN